MKQNTQQFKNSVTKKGKKPANSEEINNNLTDQELHMELLDRKCFNFIQNLVFTHQINLEVDYREFLIKWFQSLHDIVEYHHLSGKKQEMPIETKAVNEFPLFSSQIWPLRVYSCFISKLLKMDYYQIYSVIYSLEKLMIGKFDGCFKLDITLNQNVFMTEFVVKRAFSKQYDLLFMVGIEQIPILNEAENQITKFEFCQYIMAIDLIERNTVVDTNYIKIKYQSLIYDPAKFKLSRTPVIIETDYDKKHNKKIANHIFYQTSVEKGTYQSIFKTEPEYKLEQKMKAEYKIIHSNRDEDYDNKDDVMSQQKFQAHFLSFEESQQYEYDYDIYRWVLKEQKILDQKFKEKYETALQNKILLQQLADFSQASNLVELLQNIPNLNLKLTDEEVDIIGQPGNVLVIGRSGTGKTTSALLRLFAMEIIFHIRFQIYKQKNNQALQDASTNEQIGMQSVFITASPVLVNQIKKYYQKLLAQVKDLIRRQQILEKTQQKQNEDQSAISILSVEEIKSFIKILKECKNENQEVIQEEQTNKKEEEKSCFREQKNIDEKELSQINNQNDDEDMFEEDDMNNQFVLTEQGVKFKSLSDLRSQDFPAFFTVRQYLMLIEGCLHKPFFLKDKDSKLSFQIVNSSWGNYKSEKQIQKLNSKVFQDDEIVQNSEEEEEIKKKEEDFYKKGKDIIEEQYQRYIYLQSHQIQVGDIPDVEELTPLDRKFEVDYAYVKTAFWPIASAKFRDSSLISCNTLWTEIYSYIKGSCKSFSYKKRYLPREDYMQQKLNPLLSKEQKEVIYKMFEYYESWKLKQQGYDLMDLVNYLLQEIQKKKCDLPSIHFTMIDEVQDLPYAIITLFSIVNESNLFLAGDSAQTIARGVGFKFGDLNDVFAQFPDLCNKKLDPPTTRYLTINFRSHNKILQLSNSVISLIEGLFPTSIDILKKERSNIDGQKPIVLQNSEIGFLFNLLQGQQSEQEQIPLEFGCHQAIIVKDEESKKRLPAILQHAICLTIYEAKGLEFDDVILFNFFADSNATHNQWESVNLLHINSENISKASFLEKMTIHNSVFSKDQIFDINDPSFASAYGVEYDQQQDLVTLKTVVTKSSELKAFDRISNALLCSELKQLYTAVTRPKNRLIIFDTNILCRKFVDRYWQKQDLVSFISQTDFEPYEKTYSQNEKYQIQQTLTKEKQDLIKNVKQLLVKNTAEEWQEQGLKMFKYKYFEQALKCFKKSGNLQWEKKAQAYYEAQINQQKIVEIEKNLQLLQKSIGPYSLYKNQAKKIAKSNLQKELKRTQNRFGEIAELFLEINRKKQAAQCYFSGCCYDKSAEIYLQINQIREAAESLFLDGKKFQQASELYEQIKDYCKALQCYEHMQDWNKALMLILKNPSIFGDNEQQKLIKKYSNLAFQAINLEIERKNYPEKYETIKENQSKESFSSFNSEHIEDENNNEIDEQYIQVVEQNIIDKKLDEIYFNNREIFEQIKDYSEENQRSESKQKDNSKSDYQIVEKDKSKMNEISFELLSNLDQHDQSFRSISSYIVDKLNQSRTSENISFSQFSILKNSVIIGEEFEIIQTSENTSISDKILVKVLSLLAITDSQIKQKLNQINNTVNKDEEIILNQSENALNYDIPLLENFNCNKIDQEIILLVIQYLLNCHQLQLALQICNRFKVKEEISPILVQLVFNYSPFSKKSAIVSPSLLNQQSQVFQRKQKEESIIYNNALHFIFESLDPELIQRDNQNNIFNAELIKSFLLFGFWKRILYLIDKKTALSIVQTFGDFSTYKQLNQDQSQPLVEKNIPTFNLLPLEEPSDDYEVELAIISLEHYIYYIIETNFVPINSVKQIVLPEYFKFNKFIWDTFNNKKATNQEYIAHDTIKELLITAKSILTKFESNLSQIQIFDVITAFSLLINYDYQFKLLNNELPYDIQVVISSLPKIIQNIQRSYVQNYNKNSNIILKAILTTFQVRVIPEDSDILSIFGRNRLIFQKNIKLAPRISKNYKGISDHGNMYYCDIDFEYITAPRNGLTTQILNQFQECIKEIIRNCNNLGEFNEIKIQEKEKQKKEQSLKNKIDKDNLLNLNNDQKEQLRVDYAYEQVDYQLKDLEEKLLKNSELLLQYGFSEKYNQETFEKNRRRKIVFYQNLYKQIILNLIINYPSDQKFSLTILEVHRKLLTNLEEKQMLLFDSSFVKDFKELNPLVLLVSQNEYDNCEDIDEICQTILKYSKQLKQHLQYIVKENPQTIDDKRIQQEAQFLINMSFTLLANANDVEKESMKDLIEAIKILKLKYKEPKFLENSQNYQKLIESQSVKDMRASMQNLISEINNQGEFKEWVSLEIFNKSNSDENTKMFNQLTSIIKGNIFKKKNSAFKISKFFKQNKQNIKKFKQIFSQIDLYSDFICRFAQNVNMDYIREFKNLICTKNIHFLFTILRNSEQELLRTYYMLPSVNYNLISFIMQNLNENHQLFSKFSKIVNEIIQKQITKQIDRTQSQILVEQISTEIQNKQNEASLNLNQIIYQNSAPPKVKKVVETLIKDKNIWNRIIKPSVKNKQNINRKKKN